MKYSFKLSIAFLTLFFCISIEAQHTNNNSLIEQSPYRQKVKANPNQEALWELLLSFDVTALSGAAGNAGAEWDGTYFYSTRWASNLVHKYNSTGTSLVEEFSIPGVSGLRDLAFDGTYMYGGAAANTIYQMEFNTKTLIGTIPSPVTVRFIAYDENSDAFWVGNWTDSPTLVSRSGTVLASISTGFAGQYGAAYDNVSVGGPYLYIFDQGSGAGTPQIIHQFGISTGTATGVMHDVALEFPTAAGIAGGLFTMTDWQLGSLTLGGILQGTPDNMFLYDLCLCCPPCPVGVPTNPNPANGATNIPITDVFLNWSNGSGTTQVELRFGEFGSMATVYSGSPITSWPLPGPLDYETTYQWKVIDKNDTCSTPGPTWTFTTMQNPYQLYDTIIVHPKNMQFWTGSTDSLIKTDGEVNTIYPNVGWMIFDLSSVPPLYYVTSIQFYGYVNSTNWPYWSATPMGNINPLIADAQDIYTQIMTNTAQGTAYIFSNETSSFAPGRHDYQLEVWALADLFSAISQGWFAIGFVDRDFIPTYYINFDGHTQNNPSYLVVTGEICYVCPLPPSNLTAQIIYNPGPQVQLNWQDNSTNETGFIITRKFGLPNDPGSYMPIETVVANTIEYIDTTVLPESTYTYKVYSFNSYGMFPSNTASIVIPVPVELISFSCDVENDAVILSWQTATETNNQGFEILRFAQNDKTKGWERIGFVEGNGTTAERKYYSFTDRPEPGKYKYRLKQIDFDGSFEYSSEVEAEILAPLVFSLEKNYPNPFNPSTVIRFQIPGQALNDNVLVTLKVYDVLGREVVTLVNEEKEAGKYEVEFNATSLPSGIYFYRMEAGAFVDVKKMIVIK